MLFLARHTFTASGGLAFAALVAGVGCSGTPDTSRSSSEFTELSASSGGDVGHDASAEDAAPTECISGGMGNGGGLCSSDATFRASAEEVCAEQHLTLTSFTPDNACGKDESRSATYTCCGPTPPPPPPPPDRCVSGGFGNANGVCSPDAELRATATEDCEALHLTLVAFSANESCGKGSSSAAEYDCCPAITPPPPAPKPTPTPAPSCSSGGMGNANGVCSPDSTFKASAEADCASQGETLTSFDPNESCGPGSSDEATYTCCPSEGVEDGGPPPKHS
jgi:hypothetical protein